MSFSDAAKKLAIVNRHSKKAAEQVPSPDRLLQNPPFRVRLPQSPLPHRARAEWDRTAKQSDGHRSSHRESQCGNTNWRSYRRHADRTAADKRRSVHGPSRSHAATRDDDELADDQTIATFLPSELAVGFVGWAFNNDATITWTDLQLFGKATSWESWLQHIWLDFFSINVHVSMNVCKSYISRGFNLEGRILNFAQSSVTRPMDSTQCYLSYAKRSFLHPK